MKTHNTTKQYLPGNINYKRTIISIMSQKTIGVYIPYLASVKRLKPFGYFRKLKKYVHKAFTKPDENGEMMLGVVKKIELILRKEPNDTSMRDDKNDKYLTVSAYIRFVPSDRKVTQKLIDDINSENGLRFVHNNIIDSYWIIHRQKKDKEKEEMERENVGKKGCCDSNDLKHCPLCGSQTDKFLENEHADEVADLFDRLSCNDGPSKKRIRI